MELKAYWSKNDFESLEKFTNFVNLHYQQLKDKNNKDYENSYYDYIITESEKILKKLKYELESND